MWSAGLFIAKPTCARDLGIPTGMDPRLGGSWCCHMTVDSVSRVSQTQGTLRLQIYEANLAAVEAKPSRSMYDAVGTTTVIWPAPTSKF